MNNSCLPNDTVHGRIHDMSERLGGRAQGARPRSSNPFLAMLDVLGIGALVVDPRVQILEVNETAARVLDDGSGLRRVGRLLGAASQAQTAELRQAVALVLARATL